MAQITLTIPDAIAARVLNAIAGQFGRPDEIVDGEGNVTPNPVTKAQFAKQVLAQVVKDVVKTWEANQAAEAARSAALGAVEKEVTVS